jgi:predicted aminopeptidase
MSRLLILLLLIVPLTGCYYTQAASGQWEVLRKRESIDAVVEDPDTAPELASRLRLLSDARDFSIEVLGLPDNKSYRTYTELERDYVVWNVFAVPEFSLEPKVWCFPVAGCVSYRGYFSRDDAHKEAEQLRSEGFDVAVGGVAAYSTLGKFSDPILSTMMRWDDVDLIAVLFHELAHQVVYVKNDSAFNESFATAVEEFGVKRWLTSAGQDELFADYVEERQYQQRLADIVASARNDLQILFDSDLADSEKKQHKGEHLTALVADARSEANRSGREPSGWLIDGLNNAHLISTTLYEGKLPSFRVLLSNCDEELNCFYDAAQELAGLDPSERTSRLDELLYPSKGSNE